MGPRTSTSLKGRSVIVGGLLRPSLPPTARLDVGSTTLDSATGTASLCSGPQKGRFTTPTTATSLPLVPQPATTTISARLITSVTSLMDPLFLSIGQAAESSPQ